MKQLLFIFLLLLGAGRSFAQLDTLQETEKPQPETTRHVSPRILVVKSTAADSLSRAVKPDSALAKDSAAAADSIRKIIQSKYPLVHKDTSSYKKYESGRWLNWQGEPVFQIIDYRQKTSKDDLFYLLAAIVFCLAFTRAAFPKYFRNLFVLFFRSSLRQKQAREQLLQDNLASLLINVLYFISMGLYVALWVQYRHLASLSLWILAPACAALLGIVYLGKYLFLLFAGWVFNAKDAAVSYTFIVFMVNKVMGVALIPFLLILSFSHFSVIQVSLTVSFAMIDGLFIYRYLVSFGAIRNKLKLNALHFFLYLCAVEVLPLVLIYKVLLNYMAGNF